MTTPHDDERRAHEQLADEEGTQTSLAEGDSDLTDDSDTQPGRAAVSERTEEATPTGTTGLQDYPTSG
jgi:hypothetical protein